MKRIGTVGLIIAALLLLAYGVHHQLNRSNVAVPDNLSDILAETQKHLEQLAASVERREPGSVHKHDVAVRKLISGISKHNSANTPELTGLLKQVSDASKAAHKLAHDDAWAEAALQVARAQASLAKLKGDFREIPR